MPLSLLFTLSIFAAAGLLVGTFVAINVVSALLDSGDKTLARVINDIGTVETTESIANTVAPRFTEKPKSAVPEHKPKAAHAAPAAGDAPAAAADGGAPAAAAAGPSTGAFGPGFVNNEKLTKISRVAVIEGCIVCDACVQTAPKVFKIEGDTAIVLAGADLSSADDIIAAAAGCPVEVIKYA